MKLHKTRHIAAWLTIAALLVSVGCSTQKNTAKSRWWHSFNARYNTYYNASLAYIDGSTEKENGNKDNFTEMIPLYTVGNKNSRELGKGNFDKAIEKCQKAIKLHSIKKRPVWDKKRRKTEKDIEWLNRKEYNPFLWKAWMLMGRSQFYQGAFDEAASTFSYMSRLYHTQPAIYGRARAWLAKCYIEQDWLYDAEDVIRNMSRDSIHWRAKKEWDYTYADYYIHTGDYEKAIEYLHKVIKHEMRRKQKAREWYLMGQLQAALGRKDLAMKAYRNVVKQSPPYEVEFNARIAMTEVMSDGQARKMISRLKRMAASDKNKDYLDQVYYAIGNIHLNQKDTASAISAYEKGNSKATRNGVEKGVLLLKLGDLYWAQEKYNDAQRCYGEAIGMLDKERKDYKQLAQRSKVLDELVPYTDAVHLQDSLQELAKMDEKERNAAIDRVIEALKKKEKEERDRLAEENAQNVMAQNSSRGNANNIQNPTPATPATQQNGLWYFYNPMAVNQGKATFQKQWGKRDNVDDWQRVNKTVVATAQETELTEAQLDSIARVEALEDSLSQVADSAQNDPHKREYYLAQIPFTEEQVAASDAIIMDGLYNSGVIFKDKLDNLPLSEKALRRLTDQYPEYPAMANAYYHLFLLYSRKDEHAIAATYVDRLKADYPDNEWTTLLTDPYFVENARFGEHIEDSLYAATYTAFKEERYGEVKANTTISQRRFPLGANRDKFIFIGGLGKLNDGMAEECLADMNTIVEKYPKSELAEMAGMIINGVKAGKQLKGGKFDIGNVWERRAVVLNENDSTAAQDLSPERNTDFVFMLAYLPDSVNENKLLFELAKYNFTNYMVRNFDITIENIDGLHRMLVTGFRNYDEVLQYTRQLYKQPAVVKQLGNSRTVLVSDINLPLLGNRFSYDDYLEFYEKSFAPLEISTLELLAEPAEITIEEDNRSASPTKEELDDLMDKGFFMGGGDEDSHENLGTEIEMPIDENNDGTKGETVIPIEEPVTGTETDNGSTTIPTEQPQTEKKNPVNKNEVESGTTVIPDEGQPVKQNTERTTVIEQTEQKPQTTTQTVKSGSSQPQTATKAPTLNKATTAQTGTARQKTETKKTVQKTDTTQKKSTPKKQDDDTIYFDEEDNGTATGNKKKEKKNQKDKYDLDDEYYDLEGF